MVYHTWQRLHTVPYIAERQARKLRIPISRGGVEDTRLEAKAQAKDTKKKSEAKDFSQTVFE